MSAVCEFSSDEVARYSRQLLLSDIGPAGQLKLKAARVLIVGAGGLGCPAALYLAAAGVGTIGIVDYDLVKLDNLHRQVLHTTQRVNTPKTDSAAAALSSLNPNVIVECHKMQLMPENTQTILGNYDIVLDASDNSATRYLVNDACVLLNKPLVSGSALRFEGQLTVYHYRSGPCYRCLYPEPAPASMVTNCSEAGVLGAVTGVIGSLQAMETIKIILHIGEILSEKLLLYDALAVQFRVVALRTRDVNCAVCGKDPTVSELGDYESWVGAKATDKCTSLDLLTPAERISPVEYQELLKSKTKHILLDVRPSLEFEITHLLDSRNLPLAHLPESTADLTAMCAELPAESCLICVCRRGNDSQRAVRVIQRCVPELASRVRDLAGGLVAWRNSCQPDFPIY